MASEQQARTGDMRATASRHVTNSTAALDSVKKMKADHEALVSSGGWVDKSATQYGIYLQDAVNAQQKLHDYTTNTAVPALHRQADGYDAISNSMHVGG